MQNIQLEVYDEFDKEFSMLLSEIEKRYDSISKHNRLKIDSWCRKLCQVTNNREWKKNRNLHAINIIDMILNNKIESPYDKFASDGTVPIISKSLVKSRLSNKFYEMNKEFNDKMNQNEENMKSVNEDEEFSNLSPITNMNKGYENENNLENLKEVIMKLKSDIKMKDDIIKRQNEDKFKIQNRVNELEKILNSLVNLEK